MGNSIVKTNDSFSARARALGHVLIMDMGQHEPDHEVDEAHRSDEYRQFDFKRV